MEIILNGKKSPLEKETTVKEFIENLGKEKDMNLSGAVVLINDEVVKKAEWNRVIISDGSAVEVLSFVSGG